MSTSHAVRGVPLTSLIAGTLIATAALLPETAAAQRRGQTGLEQGYVGASFLNVPNVQGNKQPAPFDKWIRLEAHYWKDEARTVPYDSKFGKNRNMMTLPWAPRKGSGTLVISIDKQSPSLAPLMALCASKTTMPELKYAVSSDRSRSSQEYGLRPKDVPAFIEFTLKNVQFAECPTALNAPEQPIVLKFGDIAWLNWQGKDAVPASFEPAPPTPAKLIPAKQSSGRTRAWIVTWFGLANDVSDKQCSVMSDKPSEADYYALMPKDVAEKERIALAAKGGPDYVSGQVGHRGPGRLNAALLPGIVPDPGIPEPQTKVARGLNLDNDDGTRGKHKNYVSADGAIRGIDNSLYSALGCVPGIVGRTGVALEVSNGQMREGTLSLTIEMSGIDDEKNDDEVFLTFTYSDDPMVKNGAGSSILSDFTFTRSRSSEQSFFTRTVRAKIVNGVVTADNVKDLRLKFSYSAQPPELNLSETRMRFEIADDGSLKGVIGGYIDWREVTALYSSSWVEMLYRLQVPAVYNSLKRHADGLKNPATGEYDGISTAFDVEGAPAFVIDPPENVAGSPNSNPSLAVTPR